LGRRGGIRPKAISRTKECKMRNDVKAKVIQVIEVEHIRGGTSESEPLRPVKTYWDLKGNLLAEYDPMSEMFNENFGKKTQAIQTPL
jgi:hypothetical protein